MLVKKNTPHIDLREPERKDMPELATNSYKDKKPERRGPMVHISGINLPLTDDHVNATGEATIKYKLRKKSKGEAYGDASNKHSYDIEIVSIKFGDKGV